MGVPCHTCETLISFSNPAHTWTGEVAGQLRTLTAKGKGLKEIAKASGGSEESTNRI